MSKSVTPKYVRFTNQQKETAVETRLMSVTEVAEQLGTSKAHAYKAICMLNAELAKEDCLVGQGKVNRAYIK